MGPAGHINQSLKTLNRRSRVRKRFQIERIALVGDRGLLTTAHLREDLKPVGLDWISALTIKHLQRLVKPHKNRTASLFPEHLVPGQVAEVSAPEDFPRERLLVCLNPRLREERQRKREELLRGTEHLLDKIAAQVRSGQSRYCLPHRARHQPPESEEAL